MDHNQISLFS